MGSMTYSGANVEFDDRLLAHLQIVIFQKLRRGESFAMSWIDALAVGDGRSSIWLHPQTDLYFKFSGSRAPSINRDWLTALMESADGTRGLVVVAEDGTLARGAATNRRG